MPRRDNGTGSIFYSKSEKRYIAEIVLSTGKKKRKRERRKVDAQRWLNNHLHNPIQGHNITINELIDQYLEIHAKPTLKKTTLNMYTQVLDRHVRPCIGCSKVRSISSIDIQKILSDKSNSGLSDQTVKHIYSLIKRIYNFAAKHDLIEKNPINRVAPPKIKRKQMRTWTKEEAHIFLNSIQNEIYFHIFVLALTTGMRQGELLGIRWQDINFENQTLSVVQAVSQVKGHTFISTPKTGQRIIKLSSFALESLPTPRKRRGLVLVTKTGKPLSPRNLLRWFRKKTNDLKLPYIRFHDLRHTAATFLLEENVHPKIVQEMLGHSTIQLTLDTYSHIIPTMQDKAADTMDSIFK